MTTTCGCGETITSEAHAQRHGKDCGLQGYPRGWAEKQGRPKLLDLFCGAGGASMGYHRAGFDVVGVDIEAQPDYPFPLYQGDALAVLHKLLDGHILGFRWPGTDGFTTWHTLGDFAAIHTSPPCQASTALTKGTNKGRDYVQLIPETRELLATTDRPTVIENVQGAEVRRDATLCGEMFGLDVIRHRYFEVDGILIDPPPHRPHRGRVRGWRHGTYYDGPYVAVYGDGGGKGSVREWQMAMGIDWTDSRKSIAEAIPPAYTEFIGRQLIEHLERAA